MSRKLLGGIASLAMLAGGLAACDRHQNVALQDRNPQQPADATAPSSMQLAQAGTPSVPVMTPTGNMNPAVKPADPAARSKGEAPQMAPTGDRLPAYTPPAPQQ